MGTGKKLARSVHRHPAVAVVVAVYLVGLTVFGLVTGSRLTIPYVLIVAVAFFGLALAEDRVHFSLVVLVGLLLWGLGHLAGGIVELSGDRILYNGLFTRWIHFDNVVHFVGFGIAGLACWEALGAWLPTDEVPTVATIVFVALLACGVGAVNEVVEFAITHALPETQVGGYENTGRDLVANLLGGLVAGGWEVSRRRRRHRPAQT
jgi:hypothetical protein